MFRKFCVVFRENCVVFHKYCVVFRENCVVFRELFVVFQEYVVVFADMGHRRAYQSFRYEVISQHRSSVDSLRFKIDIFSNI